MSKPARLTRCALTQAIILLFCIFFNAALSSGNGVTPEEEFELAMEALRFQTENVHSVCMKFKWTQWDPPEAASRSGFPSETSKRECMYIASGEKLRYEEELRFGEAEEPALKEVRVYDGKFYKTYTPFTKQGSIASESAPPLSLFQLAYPVPKGDVAGFLGAHAEDIEVSFSRDEQGKRLLLLKLSVDNLDYEISLDPSAGYQPRTIYRRGTVPKHILETTGVASGEIRSDILGYRKVDSFFFPTKAHFIYDKHMANGETIRETWRTVELEEIKVNLPVDEKQFTIDFPNDTTVTHYDLGISYVVGSPELPEGDMNSFIGGSTRAASAAAEDVQGEITPSAEGPAAADASPLKDKSSSKRHAFLLLWTAIFAIAGICVVVFIVLRKARAIERRDNPMAGNTKRRKLRPIVVIVALAVCIVSAYFLLLGTGRLVHKKSEDRADLNSSGSFDEASEHSGDSVEPLRPHADETPAQSTASQTRAFNDDMNEAILEMFELATGPEDLDEGVEELGDYFPIDKDVLPLLLKEIETHNTDLVSNEQAESLFSVLKESLYAYKVGSAALILADRLRAKYSIRPAGTEYQLGALKRHYAKEGEILPSDPEEIMRLFVDRSYGGKDGSGHRHLYNELSVQGSAIHFRKSDLMPTPLGEVFALLVKIGGKTCKNGMITRYPSIEYENSPERVVKEYGTLLYADVKVAASDADGLKYSRWKRYYWSPEDGSWLPMELVSFYAKTRKADEFF